MTHVAPHRFVPRFGSDSPAALSRGAYYPHYRFGADASAVQSLGADTEGSYATWAEKHGTAHKIAQHWPLALLGAAGLGVVGALALKMKKRK